MVDGPVDKEVCEVKHSELVRRTEVNDRRLNAHSESLTEIKEAVIPDMKEAIIRLTMLQETSIQTMKDQNASMVAIDKRVLELETQRVALAEVHMAELDEHVTPFWSTSAGQLTIKVGAVVGGVVVLAAIGKNVDPVLWANLFGK